MPKVLLTVDCKAAHHQRCYTPEIVKIAEQHVVPLTWLIHTSGADPSANTQLYYHEYFHKIPSWHEIGMNVYFENDRGYVEDPKERGSIIQIAKDVLKSHRIKATSFRAGCFALLPSDLKYLEEVKIIADSSSVSGSDYRMFVDWGGAPTYPYRPSYEDLKQEGNSKIVIFPVTCAKGQYAYLDKGAEEAIGIIEAAGEREVYCIGMRDYMDCAAALDTVIQYFKGRGSRFLTLTNAASEFFNTPKK
ncbi:MAG TPA: hypothetical protein VNK96_06535 [Fimbriimonadales bacterium]|nr:hypothetical protein [Fimbriimonadales bacterium]